MSNTVLKKDKKDNPTKLLFFDNLDSTKPTYNVFEVFFLKAVNIQQFRILKQDSNPHAKYKSMLSKTQKDIIYNFEIFGRNLKKIDDKFELIFKCDNINKTNGETDNIFPLLEEFTTNHIVFRGKFEMITLCIYGTTCDNNENSILIEQARNDVSLEKINEKIQIKKNSQIEKNTLISKEEQTLIDKYPIEKLMEGSGDMEAFFKEGENEEKKDDMMNIENDLESVSNTESTTCCTFKEINYINKGNKNMIDKTKTGYIYYEKDLKQIIENLLNFYNLEDKNISEQLILEHHINFKNLFIILEILIDRNKAHLEDDCVFNKKNLEIFSLIPNSIISIINNSLKGLKSGETEIKFGLKLLKYISNYEAFVSEFIKNEGMEQLYNIILINNEHYHAHSSSHGKKNIVPSLLLKALALETIYKLLTFNCVYEKLIEKIDKNNIIIKDFMIKESIKEKSSLDNLNSQNNEDEKDRKSRDRDRSKERSREKNRERERERESRHRRRSKSRTHSHSSSSSYSKRYRSRSKSHNRNPSEDSNHSRMQRKDKRKNVTLNNGLQILSTLLISKKYILLTNIMKNITKKINLIQYLKNLNELINDYISSNSKKIYYLNRIQFHLQRIVKLIQKLDTPYRVNSSSNQKQESNLIDEDYPFKHYWIDYFDMNKKYFNKDIANENNSNPNSNNLDEEYNQEYIVRNCLNKYNSSFENIIITNEISELLEQYDFYNNIIILLSCPKIQTTPIFYSLSIQIKNVLSLICLNVGGINYLSKNFDNTSNLLNLLNNITSNSKNKFNDYCFRKIKIHNYLTSFEDKNEIINDKFSEILIPSQKIKNQDKANDLYVQINYLQIYYLIDYLDKYIHLFDNLSNLLDSLKSNADIYEFRQTTFDILYNINDYFNKCELGKQAFISLLNNKYFIQIFINFIEYLSGVTEEIMEYEAHILLIINLLYQVIISTDNSTAFFIFLNKSIYSFLKKMIANINTILDKKDSETIDNKIINNLNGIISLLKNLEDTSIVNLMTFLKDTIHNNIFKYSLNEKINTNDEKSKEYNEEYKLLINKFNNDDMNYLGELYKSGSLINSIYLSIKLLDIDFKINPILLIEGEGRHLHSILKYLIINTVNSFNYLLKKQMYKQEEGSMNIELINIMINDDNSNYNANQNNTNLINKNISTISEDNENIIILSNFLYYLYDILCLLLNNLLSSHVDNYRDEDIMDHLFLNISSCFNFLISFYTLDENTYKIGPYLYKKINAVQNLFNKCLELLHEICQFNTTIKLKFKDIMDRILSIPENIPCQLFLVNFILNNNNNEFTIDHFIDAFKLSPEKINTFINNQNINGLNNINFEETLMMEQLENAKNDALNLKVILSHCDQKISNFIDYVIIMGISTNDDFIKQQCALNILSIFHKFTLKGNTEIFQEIVSKIISEIKTQYEYLSKVNCLYFEDKDYDIYIPKIRNLLNCLKFINVMISSDVKFLFIFQDIAIYYINIFKYVQNYIFNKLEMENKNNVKKNTKEEHLSNYIFDITLITLEGFKFLFNNKKNFEERYFFSNKDRYDLVEELPNVNQIKDILKELNNFLLTIKSISQMIINNNNNLDEIEKDNICNKVLFLINKTFEIFLNLSTNICGQNLLFEKLSLVEFISELKKFENKNINHYLSLVIISLIKLTLVLFYEIDYYDYENKKDKNESNIEKFVISQQRLIKLSHMYISAQTEKNDENISDKIIPHLYENNNLLIELLQKNNEGQYLSPALMLIQDLQKILKEYKKDIDIIVLEKNSPVLPGMRQIQEKFELIHVYNYFRQIQGLGNESKLEFNNNRKVININYSEIISTLNGTANSNINYNQKPQTLNNEYSRNQINEFEKLLNWKKARIYMNEYDTLKIRDINFNIDSYVFSSEETFADFEYKFYQLKKKYLYISNDPFEQYCNSIDYSLHIINQFKNISAFVYDTLCTKNYLFDRNEKYMNEILELFFKTNQNEAINLEELHNLEMEIKKYKNINENSSSNRKIKKKTKSKINKFIYKQKYEKQQNNNMSQLRLTTSILKQQQEMQRFSSKVSGRNLSTHVDNVNPEKKVVNVTYNGFNNNATANSTPMPPSNINLQNANNPGMPMAPNNATVNNQMMMGENNINNNIQNIQNPNETNQMNNSNYNMLNNQNNIINQNNNQLNLVTQQSDNRQFDKNIVQQQQNQNIKNINQIGNMNQINNTTTPINNIIHMQGNNVPNVTGNNMINLSTPNNIQKNPIAINSLLNNMKSPTNNNQSSQMLLMNSPQVNLQDRNAAVNINQLPNITPNINPNPNLQNINPLNFNNINNPNITHIPQGVQGLPASNQNLIPGLQQNNNNLMNYLNPIQNPLINIQGLNQIIPGTQNYPNIHGQINNMGINPLNNGLTNNNINNNQFPNQFNPSVIPQISQAHPQQMLNKMDSNGNINNNHNNTKPKVQPKKNNDLIDKLQGILQGINSGTSSSAKDPRKNRKK